MNSDLSTGCRASFVHDIKLSWFQTAKISLRPLITMEWTVGSFNAFDEGGGGGKVPALAADQLSGRKASSCAHWPRIRIARSSSGSPGELLPSRSNATSSRHTHTIRAANHPHPGQFRCDLRRFESPTDRARIAHSSASSASDNHWADRASRSVSALSDRSTRPRKRLRSWRGSRLVGSSIAVRPRRRLPWQGRCSASQAEAVPIARQAPARECDGSPDNPDSLPRAPARIKPRLGLIVGMMSGRGPRPATVRSRPNAPSARLSGAPCLRLKACSATDADAD